MPRNAMPNAPTAPTDTPRLNATAPIRIGLLALGAAALLGAGLFFVEIEHGPVTVAASVKRAEPVVVRHDSGGTLAELHVKPGMDVAAGALLAQLDRRHIESELAALRKRVDARRMDIDGLRQEAAALSAAGDKTAARSRIAALEAEVVEADRVIIGHSARIALLEGQLDRLEIRAPVAGRVTETATLGAVIAAKGPVVTLRPSINRLQLDATWPATAGAAPAAGQPARIWQVGTLSLMGTHVGKVESIGTDQADGEARSPHDTRARIAIDVTGTPLADQRDPGLTLNVQLVTGSRSLAEHLFAPLMLRRSP